MSFSEQSKNLKTKREASQNLTMLAASATVAAILAFLLGVSNFNPTLKIGLFLLIVSVQAAVFILFIFNTRRPSPASSDKAADVETTGNKLSAEKTDKIKALRDADAIFGGRLKTDDLFRFIAKRLEEIFEFSNVVLLLPESGNDLKIRQARGASAADFLKIGKISRAGIGGRALASGEPEIDERLELEKTILEKKIFDNLNTAAAAPLRLQTGETFGALVFYGEELNGFHETDSETLRLVSETISQPFKSSLDHERSLENALTDPLTKLPNERAFYLILENQLAESQRDREGRPLTILAADVGNFEEIAADGADSTRGKIFNSAAEILKEQLREMDFIACVGANEFAAILPTATAAIAESIVERIEQAAAQKSAEMPEAEKIVFNFGAATFYQDGETGQELYQTALVKKDQAKKGENSVLWFDRKGMH